MVATLLLFQIHGQRGSRSLKSFSNRKMPVGAQMVVVRKAFVEHCVSLVFGQGIEDQQMQQYNNEYWPAQFRARIAERPTFSKPSPKKTNPEAGSPTACPERSRRVPILGRGVSTSTDPGAGCPTLA